jgi:hypothetical protein
MNLWTGVAAVAALGVGTTLAVHQTASAAPEDVQLTREQLLINQRISQAAVLRSNEGLRLLDPLRGTAPRGWPTGTIGNLAVTEPKLAVNAVTSPKIRDATVTGADLADGTVASADLAPDVRDRLPLWVIGTSAGTLVRQNAGGTAQVAPLDPGRYRVTFTRDVSACAWTATVSNVEPGLPPVGFVRVGRDADVKQLIVGTTDADGAPANRPFHLVVTC